MDKQIEIYSAADGGLSHGDILHTYLFDIYSRTYTEGSDPFRFNSLVWGAVLSLFVFPFIRKVLK